MTFSRPLKWITGIVLALIVVAALMIAFFDWNLMRGPIANRISTTTGRSVAINGDLTVKLSMQPHVVVNDIVLGNVPGSSEPQMAGIKRLEFTIDLFKFLTGRIELPDLSLTEPRLLLEVQPGGAPNWLFKGQSGDDPVELPVIGNLRIERGSLTYRDPLKRTELVMDVRTLAAGNGHAEARLAIDGKGRYRGEATSVHAIGGAILTMGSAKPYPIEATAVSGNTKAGIKGTLVDPLHLTAQQLNFTLEGSDLAHLYPLTGIPMPPTPAYKLAGFIDHAAAVWKVHDLKGKVGDSDLAGEFSLDRGKKPQRITATLVSQKLVMQDLAGFIGAKPGAQPAGVLRRGGKILPTEPFSPEKLQAADADVQFRGVNIITEKMPLENMKAHLLISGGVLKLAPLDFGAAGGHLIAQVEMDGRRAPIATSVDLVARGLDLQKLLPNSKLAADNTGTMGGRAKLVGNGNSVAQLLATANGEAALIMDGGSVGELTLRMANLDIANSMLLLIGGDKQTPIRCMVGNFNAKGGIFNVQELVLDTPKVNITGTGHIDLNDESLHLRMVAKSKGFSLASLRGPIAITGTFSAPVARPELGGALVRGGAAVVLGVATAGIGALLPLLDFGKERDSNCAALISEAKTDVGVKASDIRGARPGAAASPKAPAGAGK